MNGRYLTFFKCSSHWPTYSFIAITSEWAAENNPSFVLLFESFILVVVNGFTICICLNDPAVNGGFL